MILITSGCSFSECISTNIDTWPRHLSRYLGAHLKSLGLGSQGNGLIMRKLLRNLETCDKTDDLLVGIMWSGPNRKDFFNNDPYFGNDDYKTINGYMENPTNLIGNTKKGWVIMNHNWSDRYSQSYYSNFYDPIYSQLQTLEYILHTQWYLERRNIRYFMMTYTNHVFDKDLLSHPETDWLYKQIDMTKFVPAEGCYEWCRDNTDIPFAPDDNHPDSEQHRLFTKSVILPYLFTAGLIQGRL